MFYGLVTVHVSSLSVTSAFHCFLKPLFIMFIACMQTFLNLRFRELIIHFQQLCRGERTQQHQSRVTHQHLNRFL